MKLAEALVERRAAFEKLESLSERLQSVALVQEGEAPAEDPTTMLRELGEVTGRITALIVAINRTNIDARVADGRTIMEAIAERDVLRHRIGVLDALRAAAAQHYRQRGAEIRLVSTVDVAALQRERDGLAKRQREVDTMIQEANWTHDLTT